MSPGLEWGIRQESTEDTGFLDSRQLEALIVDDPGFAELDAAFDVFCPFEAIGMVKQEIRHAYFLAHILDPNRSHGFGTSCTQAFLRLATRSTRTWTQEHAARLSPLDIHLMDWDQVEVRREWRRIDLLFVSTENRLVVAIELKIGSKERDGQLANYKAIVQQEWPVADHWQHLFVFLTKDWDEPGEGQKSGWTPIGLDDLANELLTVAGGMRGSPAGSFLQSYLDMLRRHHLPNEKLENLAAKIWARHAAAIEYLIEHRPDAARDVMDALRAEADSLAKDMGDAAELVIVPDDHQAGILRFRIQSWEVYPAFKGTAAWTSSKAPVLIEIARGSPPDPNFSIRLVIGKAEPEVRRSIYHAFEVGGAKLGNRGTLSQTWTRVGTTSLGKIKWLNGGEGYNLERTVEDLKKGAYRFAKEDLPSYDRALRLAFSAS